VQEVGNACGPPASWLQDLHITYQYIEIEINLKSSMLEGCNCPPKNRLCQGSGSDSHSILFAFVKLKWRDIEFVRYMGYVKPFGAWPQMYPNKPKSFHLIHVLACVECQIRPVRLAFVSWRSQVATLICGWRKEPPMTGPQVRGEETVWFSIT
jgi:hypothetical protein